MRVRVVPERSRRMRLGQANGVVIFRSRLYGEERVVAGRLRRNVESMSVQVRRVEAVRPINVFETVIGVLIRSELVDEPNTQLVARRNLKGRSGNPAVVASGSFRSDGRWPTQ